MPMKPKDYRLRIIEMPNRGDGGYHTFIVRKKDRVFYCSGDQTPLALSNLLGNKAAEIEFRLEDAFDGRAAYKIVREALDIQWSRNPDKAPKVEFFV